MDGKELTLVAYYKGIAVLKGWNEYTPFVGTRSFDFKTNEWNHGHYFETKEAAHEWFREEVNSYE